jgi:hypothetical protein
MPALLRRPAVLLTVVALAAITLTLLAWPTGGDRSVAAAPAQPYADVLRDLDAQRAAAFATGEPEALTRVYQAGTEALSRDTQVLSSFAARGQRVAGLRHELVSVTALEASGDRVVLRVVDRMPAFRVESAEGDVVERHAGRAEQTWRVDLVRTGGGWRIAALAATPQEARTATT